MPSEGESATVFSRLPLGSSLHVEVRRPRNGKHHRLYWVLCHRMANAIGCDSEALSDFLKVKTGHVRIVKTKDGIEEFPASISYASMDQDQFREFFDKCIIIISEKFGIARPDILDAIADLIADKREAA